MRRRIVRLRVSMRVCEGRLRSVKDIPVTNASHSLPLLYYILSTPPIRKLLYCFSNLELVSSYLSVPDRLPFAHRLTSDPGGSHYRRLLLLL